MGCSTPRQQRQTGGGRESRAPCGLICTEATSGGTKSIKQIRERARHSRAFLLGRQRGWPWRTGVGSPGRVKYVSPQPHGRSCPEMQLRPETQTSMPGGCLDHVAYLHRAGQSGGRGVYCSGLGSPVTPAVDAGVLVAMNTEHARMVRP